MPLDVEALASAMKSEVESEMTSAFGTSVMTEQKLVVFCHAVSKSIIDHIKANAVVSVTGVQSGGGTATGVVS